MPAIRTLKTYLAHENNFNHIKIHRNVPPKKNYLHCVLQSHFTRKIHKVFYNKIVVCYYSAFKMYHGLDR